MLDYQTEFQDMRDAFDIADEVLDSCYGEYDDWIDDYYDWCRDSVSSIVRLYFIDMPWLSRRLLESLYGACFDDASAYSWIVAQMDYDEDVNPCLRVMAGDESFYFSKNEYFESSKAWDIPLREEIALVQDENEQQVKMFYLEAVAADDEYYNYVCDVLSNTPENCLQALGEDPTSLMEAYNDGVPLEDLFA